MSDLDPKSAKVVDDSPHVSDNGGEPLLQRDWTHQEEVKAKRK
jgi:hypothetical protein